MKFRKKPVVIDAYQFDGTYNVMKRIEKLFPDLKTTSVGYHKDDNIVDHWRIATLEGSHTVSTGDWIIRGIKGEFYPCKPDIFEKTYDAI